MKLPGTVVISRVRRIAAVTVCLGYLVTWVFGVPTVVSDNDRMVVEEFKRVLSNGERDDIRSSHSRFITFAAFPALPGVVISIRAYAAAGRYGWAGVQGDLCWPGGVRQWFKITWMQS